MTTAYIPSDTLDQLAEAMRRKSNIDDDVAINITKLAEAFDCDVYEVKFNENDISGTFTIEDGKKIIRVNKEDSEERKRFTIAHELAHSILHIKDHESTTHIDYRKPRGLYSDGDIKKEIQANMLAAALLMPKTLVQKLWNKYKDIDDLANLFCVSKSAATIRLDSLGLID